MRCRWRWHSVCTPWPRCGSGDSVILLDRLRCKQVSRQCCIEPKAYQRLSEVCRQHARPELHHGGQESSAADAKNAEGACLGQAAPSPSLSWKRGEEEGDPVVGGQVTCGRCVVAAVRLAPAVGAWTSLRLWPRSVPTQPFLGNGKGGAARRRFKTFEGVLVCTIRHCHLGSSF